MDANLERRRRLRRLSTDAEARLWKHLRAKQLGFKFRRQHPCEPYILDFYCDARKLAVEVDGSQHLATTDRAYDERRSAFLATRGIAILRFPNDDVLRETQLKAVVSLSTPRITSEAKALQPLHLNCA